MQWSERCDADPFLQVVILRTDGWKSDRGPQYACQMKDCGMVVLITIVWEVLLFLTAIVCLDIILAFNKAVNLVFTLEV